MSLKFSSQLKTLDGTNSLPSDSWLNLNILVERCLGNTQLALRILNSFRPNLIEMISKITESYESENDELLKLLSHRLRGEAANVGAGEIANSAQKLEEALLNQVDSRDDLQRLLNELISAADYFTQHSTSQLEALSNSHNKTQP